MAGGGDSQSTAQHELQVEAREDPCSDSAPSIVLGTIRLLVEQQGCLSICADGRLYKGMTNYCPGSHHVGLEEEGRGEGGKLRSFFFACVFSPLKKKTQKNQQNPHKFGLLQLFSSLLTKKKLFSLKRQAVPGCGPTTTAQYVGGSHIHTSYLCPPASPAANTMFQFVKPLLGNEQDAE